MLLKRSSDIYVYMIISVVLDEIQDVTWVLLKQELFTASIPFRLIEIAPQATLMCVGGKEDNI